MPRILDLAKAALPAPVKKLLRRAVHRLRHRPFKPYLKKKNVEGVAFDLWIGDKDGRDWYDLQSTDPEWAEMRFIKDHIIEPGDVILECGGHHGCTAIILSNWVGDGGKVVTFEALPENCDIIAKNIRLNQLSNVTLKRKAVGAEHGKVHIKNKSNASVDPSDQGIEVDVTPLDDYQELAPNFLKIDVEGFEIQVLRGAQQILATRPKLAIEIHPNQLVRYGATVQELFQLLDLDSYQTWMQWQDGQPPEAFDMTTPIVQRAHLFAVPAEEGRFNR